jgi:thioredoxin reductase
VAIVGAGPAGLATAVYASSERNLEAMRWWLRPSGEEVRRPIRHLFLFIGADPNTDWLAGSGVALDLKGFVLTGTVGNTLDKSDDGPPNAYIRNPPTNPLPRRNKGSTVGLGPWRDPASGERQD